MRAQSAGDFRPILISAATDSCATLIGGISQSCTTYLRLDFRDFQLASQVDVTDPVASRFLHSRLTGKPELPQAMFHTHTGELTTTRSEKAVLSQEVDKLCLQLQCAPEIRIPNHRHHRPLIRRVCSMAQCCTQSHQVCDTRVLLQAPPQRVAQRISQLSSKRVWSRVQRGAAHILF